MLNSLIIIGEKGKKPPRSKFRKKNLTKFRYIHKLSKNIPESSKIKGGDAF